MSEVRLSPAVTTRAVSGSASSVEGIRSDVAADGKVLPPAQEAPKTSPQAALSVVDPVNQAVAELNHYVQNEQRDLLFSVDDGSGEMVVRVLDRESGELIRQIPNEVALELAQKARLNEPLQLIDMHG